MSDYANNYRHPADTNLNKLTTAMEYDAEGKPVLRVRVDGGQVTISGDVVVDEVGLTAATLAALETTTVLQGTDPWVIGDGGGSISIDDGGNVITVDGTVNVGNFPATQTVDGTVNIGTMPNVTLNQPVAVTDNGGTLSIDDGGGSITVDGTVTATISGDITTTFAAAKTDAFGRLRVSNPVTVFDAQNRYVDGEQFSSDNSGSGGVTYNANSSNFTLSVSGNGDEVVRQAKRVTLYQPGKSLLIMNTFAMNTPTNNLRQRVGYFTAQNGIFLEADGTTINIVKRSYTSGSAVDTKVAQASWNGDTFNGAGASGITLDVSKTHILWTDIEWLGVGSVRVGFVINGVFYLAHTFHHANSLTDVYMTTASLNCRYEITSTGASGSMRQICSTVISEGGYEPTPPIRSVSNGTVEKRLSSADTLYPLATIRLDPNTPDCVVMPAQIDFLSTDVKYGEIQLVEGATLTGASFNNNESTTVETDTSATAMTGGSRVYSALWASRIALNLEDTVKKRLQLAREADGTPITLTFAAASNGGNTDILYKFGWEEWSN